MFTVVWGATALNELTDLWVNSDSAMRQAITAATHQIDKRLEQDPENQGESRSGGERIWFVFPLGIRFDVDNQQLTVRVLHVWTYRKKS